MLAGGGFCAFTQTFARQHKTVQGMPKKLQLQSDFEFEKVHGRAMLRWDGKKPLERIEYFPAQEKEVYGDKNAKDFNKLFWGDNLQVLAHLLKEYRGKIDLIYIDPPFDSKADYVKKVQVKGERIEGQQQSIIEEQQYHDIWEKDEYLQFIYDRLILMRELLSERGSFFLHCDWHKAAHLRLILDEVFGDENFVNEIVWHYSDNFQGNVSGFATNHNNIYWYSKTQNYKAQKVMVPLAKLTKRDRRVWSKEEQKLVAARDEQGKIIYEMFSEKKADDVWAISVDSNVWEIGQSSTTKEKSKEYSGYPTQKPEELLKRIILAATEAGDLVADFFIGSGTTCVVAQKLGRRWLGCDINISAIQTSTKRLNQVIANQLKGDTDKDAWLIPENEVTAAKTKASFGFKVLNVNEYDVFKNEVEAKNIIMEMYGVEKARLSHFDGVLDSNFVKVMPINRVCSKKDVDEVLKGVRDNLGGFTAKSKSRHGESVYQEGVTIFCSGLEMDMIDYLKKNNDTGVAIDVRDILLDKQTLIFKQKPEAEITVKGDNKNVVVKIVDFISPILMRKLEIENEKATKKESKAKVEDYRQVIDSVAIDVDYDGDLFNAEIIDVPSKNELIKGEYVFEYPKAGKKKLAVKIVDVLGEEYFESFDFEIK